MEPGGRITVRAGVVSMERLEMMHRIWTAFSGLHNDLDAAHSCIERGETVTIPATMWVGPGAPEGQEVIDEAHEVSPEQQAIGFADFALFHLADALLAHHEFVQRFGGLWGRPAVPRLFAVSTCGSDRRGGGRVRLGPKVAG